MSDSTALPDPGAAAPSEGGAAPATLIQPPEAAPAPVKSRRKLLITVIAVLVGILLIVGAAFTWYLVTRKPLTQLPVLSQAIPISYSSTVYEVAKPLGVAVDEVNNRMYVTQSAGDRDVAIFDLDGNRLGVLTPPGDSAALHTPVYVAVNPQTSDVYVSDRATATIYVYDANGAFVKEFTPKGEKAWQPMGLAFDSAGNLYATDVSDPVQRVLRMGPDGTVQQVYGEKDELAFPNGVAVASDGTLYVADSNNSRVLAYAQDGTLKGALARAASDSPIGLPRGLAIDDRGRLYVVDTTNQNIQVFTESPDVGGIPEFGYVVGEEGTDEGSFEFPNGVATDTTGHVYITDRENNRLQVWSY